MSSNYSIKDLELLSGIKAHTLRIWEQRYKVLKPERTESNIRYYTNTDLRRILNISILNKNGHKISNIVELNDYDLKLEVEKYLNNYLKESDQIESLYISLLELNEQRFENIINNAIDNFGFENTIEKIVFPFLKHLGNMWQVGAISPAQEHFISNLIRQKVIANIDKAVPEKSLRPKTYLFFLPSNELHEMGLLYLHYLTKVRGCNCVYLGQSVPVEDLISISTTIQPDYIVSVFTSRMPDMKLNSFLKACQEGLVEPTFLLSGRLLMDPDEEIDLPSNRFILFKDFNDYKQRL
ncbi:MerR family transcriptional regulator [Aurantibacillus circumpalustris]|uniref:MerR family transcriptional regulator n=1 Tax=Aurantibacillus circumpalustris TaxID=3036359 RepID=UPI00295A93E4|nr:MerR family transcriptional regulator [Aurantibacillus circumpalustris]